MIGRALREKMRDDADERAHPERARERVRHRAICEQARREREARFPVLTAENAAAAIAWQAARIAELERREVVR